MVSQAGIAAEPLIRLGAFLGVFVIVAFWEAAAPRRRSAFTRRARWPHNLGLLVLDGVVVRLVAPGAAIAVAIAGGARRLLAVSIATGRTRPVSPCGMCRQALAEHAAGGIPVRLVGRSGTVEATTLAALLPRCFTRAELSSR